MAPLQTANDAALSDFVVKWGGKHVASIGRGATEPFDAAGHQAAACATVQRRSDAIQLVRPDAADQRLERGDHYLFQPFAPDHILADILEGNIPDLAKLRGDPSSANRRIRRTMKKAPV
ncbi:hypothetical protein DPM13_00765 [Paracoccus mutanolyticus]|uniref:Uncharacterized protein n=1 Tax=Paracoccus mutanolyticus TaxID=1499308 RepID=A0ABN5M3H6_9RHOB|nr:hypothetical protein [Paracoccus mutanolyticus]AWX92309.1 hypothetical protein DPM13_00765 [Paracoccus mutanolyticus]